MQFPKLIAVSSLIAVGALYSAAQSRSDLDPTHRPAPMYSKSEKKRMEKFRRVQGIVKDEQDNAVNGALVNLKNLKNNQTLTFITKADGKYFFDELSRDEDYEISATRSGKTTQVKRLSHYDPQTSTMRILSFGETDPPMSVKSEK